MAFPVLLTRLFPPEVRDQIIVRSRLLGQLDEASQHVLTLISAPAGFGKTTLLVNWIRQTKMKSAWLGLENGDNEPHKFFSYLVSTLAQVEPGLLESTRSFLQEVPLQQEALLTALLNKLVNLKEDLILILDDYHVIENPELHTSMMFFLDHLPSAVHVILSTRSDPPMKFSRLRGRGLMGDIRVTDLRFTTLECIAFFNELTGLALSPEQIGALERRTEGWAAGLSLAIISMQKLDRWQVGEFIENLTSSNRFVLDYLTDEVLNSLDENLHTFLLETSILGRLSGPLCDAVTGRRDSEKLLDQMEKDNLFLFPLDEDRCWYRYHALFSDLLKKRLVSVDPDHVSRLHLRASQWLEAHNNLSEAIDHALASSDLERAHVLIEENILDALFRGEFILARGWLEKLPKQMLQVHPLFQLAWAWTHILPGEWDLAEVQLKQIQDAIEMQEEEPYQVQQGQTIQRDSLSCYLLVLQALVARGRGDPIQTQYELIARALSLAPQDDPALRAMLEQRLGICYLDFGNEAAAKEAFRKAEQIGWSTNSINNAIQAVYTQAVILRRGGKLLEMAEICRQGVINAERKAGNPSRDVPMAGVLQIMLGTVLVEWDELEEAEMQLVRSLPRLEPISQYWEVELQVKGYFALARLKLVQDRNYTLPNLVRLAALAKPILVAYAEALQARLQLIQSQRVRMNSFPPVEVLHWASGVEVRELEVPLVDWSVYEELVCMRVHAACGASSQGKGDQLPDLQRDLVILEQLIQQIDVSGWVDLGIEARLVRARLYIALNKDEDALKSLAEAVQHGEAKGYLRIFLEEGSEIVPYLYRLTTDGFLPDYTRRLLAATEAFVDAQPDQRGDLIESLTLREIEVLKVIAEGLSNQEIGQRLSISMGTVKRHTANINRKLEVHSRSQAAARARTLGILDESRD